MLRLARARAQAQLGQRESGSGWRVRCRVRHSKVPGYVEADDQRSNADDELFMRVSGDWFAGAPTEFTLGCARSDVSFGRPSVVLRQQLGGGFVLTVRACADAPPPNELSVQVVYDYVPESGGEQTLGVVRVGGGFGPIDDVGRTMGFKGDALEELELPVDDWASVTYFVPPEFGLYRGSVVALRVNLWARGALSGVLALG